MDHIRRELGERLEDETSLVHERVRNHELFAGKNLVVVEQDVQVDRPRIPFHAAVSAEGFFNFEHLAKQRVSAEKAVVTQQLATTEKQRAAAQLKAAKADKARIAAEAAKHKREAEDKAVQKARGKTIDQGGLQ